MNELRKDLKEFIDIKLKGEIEINTSYKKWGDNFLRVCYEIIDKYNCSQNKEVITLVDPVIENNTLYAIMGILKEDGNISAGEIWVVLEDHTDEVWYNTVWDLLKDIKGE